MNTPQHTALSERSARQKRMPAGYFAYSSFSPPPLAEQQRIAKVGALMALRDRLETSLTAVVRRRLLDALPAEALAPADDRELEAAE